MGPNQNAQKLLSTDLVNTKKSYALKLEKSVIIIYTFQNIKPLHHAVAAQWIPLLGILFEEVLLPAIKDHERYARTNNISGLSVGGCDDDSFFSPD